MRPQRRDHNHQTMMRRRILGVMACLLYGTVALLLAQFHDHQDQPGIAAPHQCAACEWQAVARTDIPIAVIFQPVIAVQFVILPAVTIRLVTVEFTSATASRAPPLAVA